MFKNWFNRERKQSAAGAATAINLVGRPVWTPRNYACLAAEGFGRNAVAYRCIRMIAEACASVPLRVEFGGRRAPEHPLQTLIDRPNAGLHLWWRERGGPEVRQPETRGFGTTLIADLPRSRLHAEVELEYAAKGLQWSLRGNDLLAREDAAVAAR